MVTRRITGEQMTVMEVKGKGPAGSRTGPPRSTWWNLQGDKLYVESSNLLATDAGLRTGTSFTGLRGASQGNGLLMTTVEGHGQAAITSDGPAVVLRVSSQYPLTGSTGGRTSRTRAMSGSPSRPARPSARSWARAAARPSRSASRATDWSTFSPVSATRSRGTCDMPFREAESKMIEATVLPGQRLFSQRGAMLAYKGEVSFTPNVQGGQGGIMSMIGRRVANEATPLMTVEGSGTVFFDGGHHIQVINLSGDTLYVEANRLLAFDGTLQQGAIFLGSQGGVMGMVRGQVTGRGSSRPHSRGTARWPWSGWPTGA